MSSNVPLGFDYLFGFRAWGLILYGALPASLAALGILKIPAFQGGAGEVLVPFLTVATIPVLVLYLLIRQRMAAWYLMKDRLGLRSAVLTFAIFALSTLISGAAGLIQGRYVPWSHADRLVHGWWVRPVVESVMIAVVILVGSSTLFLTAIKEAGGLPALPSADFVRDLKALREAIISIQSNSNDVQATKSPTVRHNLTAAKTSSARLILSSPQRSARRKFYGELKSDLELFDKALQQVLTESDTWKRFFPSNAPESSMTDADQKKRTAVQKIKRLRVNV